MSYLSDLFSRRRSMSPANQGGRNRDASLAKKSGANQTGGRATRLRSRRRTLRAKRTEREFTQTQVNRRRSSPGEATGGRRGARNGIRIRGQRGNAVVRDALIRYSAWLRSKHDFPVRVPVYLLPGDTFVTAENETVVSSFFAPFDRSQEPYIRIATGDFPQLQRESGRDNALAAFILSLSRQVAHYWQWVRTGETWESGVGKQALSMLRDYEKCVSRP
jgi:hypothetical protein